MAFQATVRRWGNALGVTVPKDVARKLGVGPDTKVEVEVRPVPLRLWGLWGELKGITFEEGMEELERMEEEDEEAEREHERLSLGPAEPLQGRPPESRRKR